MYHSLVPIFELQLINTLYPFILINQKPFMGTYLETRYLCLLSSLHQTFFWGRCCLSGLELDSLSFIYSFTPSFSRRFLDICMNQVAVQAGKVKRRPSADSQATAISSKLAALWSASFDLIKGKTTDLPSAQAVCSEER